MMSRPVRARGSALGITRLLVHLSARARVMRVGWRTSGARSPFTSRYAFSSHYFYLAPLINHANQVLLIKAPATGAIAVPGLSGMWCVPVRSLWRRVTNNRSIARKTARHYHCMPVH